MADDSDIASLLPQPPPPRPVRRDAAIGAAMRRFDGEKMPAPAAVPHSRPIGRRLGYGQIGALASVALVALIGIPIALTSLGHRLPMPGNRAPVSSAQPAVAQAPAVAGSTERFSPPVPAATIAPTGAGTVHPATPPVTQSARVETARPPQPAFAPAPMAPPPPPAPAPQVGSQEARDKDSDVVVTGTRIRSATPAGVTANAPTAVQAAEQGAASRNEILSQVPQASNNFQSLPPVTPGAAKASAKASRAQAAKEARGQDIVVTGSQIRPGTPAPPRRGDWNACTVNDPDENLAHCKRQLNPAAKGAAGLAAAQLAEGLSQAWEGNTDAAIAAFDRAIALAPRLGLAYLNRGLAHQRRDEFDAALADLDRAVRHAPYAARNYYNRAQLLRAHGDPRRADKDEQRAIELDPDYEVLVK